MRSSRTWLGMQRGTGSGDGFGHRGERVQPVMRDHRLHRRRKRGRAVAWENLSCRAQGIGSLIEVVRVDAVDVQVYEPRRRQLPVVAWRWLAMLDLRNGIALPSEGCASDFGAGQQTWD